MCAHQQRERIYVNTINYYLKQFGNYFNKNLTTLDSAEHKGRFLVLKPLTKARKIK